MTNAEAITVIEEHICRWCTIDEHCEECELYMATEALEKQIPKPPIPDENATGIDGKPVPRCQVCGYALDLRIEQYCPCCGQRLTEYEEVDE